MLGTALAWLLIVELFSLIAFPIAYFAFPRLPDRGWTASKPLGMLLVGIIVWYLGLSQILVNSRLTVIAALVLVATISLIASRGHWSELVGHVRTNLSTLITIELLFITIFLSITLLRSAIPEISHTEQPMDLMLLNAVVVSPHYPPNDPWLAGASVSYYYLGYLMIGTIALVTNVATPIAFNLGLATVGAVGAIAAFGLTFNLTKLARASTDAAILTGITTVVLLLVASNLAGFLEMLRAAGSGSVDFYRFVAIDGLHAPAVPSTQWYPDDNSWWWWRASRVIPNAITEFPAFSFLLGDMHPHVMSIGFVLLSATVALQLYLQRGLLKLRTIVQSWPLLLVATSSIAGLAAINLWDTGVALALTGGSIFLNAARHERSMGFGRSLAIHGSQLIVGAPGIGSSGSSAFIYKRSGTRWRIHTELSPSEGMDKRSFGYSVALESEIALIGSPAASTTGLVYIFTDSGSGNWRWTGTIRPNPDAREFGRAISLNGSLLVIGAKGSAWAYRHDGNRWFLEEEFAPLDVVASGSFGSSVGTSEGIVAIGSPNSAGGSVHLYQKEQESWMGTGVLHAPGRSRGMGRALAFERKTLAIGCDGAAMVFHEDGNVWVEDAFLRPPIQTPASTFGGAVALSNNWLVVGADADSNPAPNAGVSYIYQHNESKWNLHARLVADDVGVDGRFGGAVALEHEVALVGADGGGNGGVYAFSRVLDTWNRNGKLIGRWRFGRAFYASLLLAATAILIASPFLANFETNAGGILPLRGIMTHPIHLLLIWGVSGFLVLPMLTLIAKYAFHKGNWSLMRLGVSSFIGFAPLVLWLQPIYGPPFYVVALLFNGLILFLFSLHRAGYRLPRVDEMSFAFNSGVTRVVGTILLVSLLLYDGVANGERGSDGRYLALDRLLIVTPMAIVVTLAIYSAWTLAHRDSEKVRQSQSPQFEPFSFAMLMLGVGSALIMGVELFHVADYFGGDLRRLNTVFKLYYQAWILMAVLGGFAIWYTGSRFDKSRLRGRFAVTLWGAVLVIILGAVTYYPAAGVATRISGNAGFTLDGQQHIHFTHPAEYRGIDWIRLRTPRGAIVLESAVVRCSGNPSGCSSFTEAGRISSSTGRPTILGWEGHERQWRASSVQLNGRKEDVALIYQTEDIDVARGLLKAYQVDYVVVGHRERDIYGSAGLAKFAKLGNLVFDEGDPMRIYRLGNLD